MADRLQLSYEEKDEQGRTVATKTLPFHLGIIGAFSGRSDRESHDDAFLLTRSTFAHYFTQCEVEVNGQVENLLYPESGDAFLSFSLVFLAIEEFNPRDVVEQLGFLQDYLQFLKRFERCVGAPSVLFSEVFEADDRRYIEALQIKGDEIAATQIINGISEGYRRVNLQINAVLYHKLYREVEHNWLSLKMLLGFANFAEFRISVIDTHWDLMTHDLSSGLEVTETELFDRIYAREVDQYGGVPYSMLLNTFTLSAEDLEVAKMLGEIGRLSSCPIINNVAPDLFDIPDMSYLANQMDLTDLRTSDQFEPWATFAATPSARFLTLLLQEAQSRPPYLDVMMGQAGDIRFTDKPPSLSLGHGLYGTATYAFALPFIRAYQNYNSCFGADEPDVNLISGDIYGYHNARMLSPTLGRRSADRLAEFGFVSLLYSGTDGSMMLGTLNQFNANAALEKGVNAVDMQTRMNVRMPQLLFISQLTHYLRMIQRQSVAKSKPQQLRVELNNWIRRFISDGAIDSPAIRAQRPLKKVQIELVEVERKGGKMIEFQLTLQPHSKYHGLDYELTL